MLKRIIDRFVDFNCGLIFRHPIAYLCSLVLITAVAGYFYAKLPVDTSVESLIIENDPDLVFYEKFKSQFGEDEFLVVGFESSRIFTSEFLDKIEQLTAGLETIPGVKEVVSLTSVEDILGTDSDFIVQPLVPADPVADEDIARIISRIDRNSLIKGNVISEDGKASLFLLRTKGQEGDRYFDARLVEAVNAYLAGHPDLTSDLRLHVAGWLITDTSMAAYMNRDLALFMPITYLVIALLLWIFLHNWLALSLSLVNISICLVWTMAFLYLSGGAMSPMTSILPPLVMALVVSDSVHYLQKFLQTPGDDIQQRIREVMLRLAYPCFLTSFTDAQGFASLALSSIPPIRHFGLAAAAGMMAEYFLTMTIIPLGLLFWGKKHHIIDQGKVVFRSLDRISVGIGELVTRRYRAILGVSLALVVIFAYGATQIQVETNLLEYFRDGSTIRRDSEFIDTRLGGVNTLEISLRSSQREYFLDPAHLRKVDEVSEYLQGIAVVSKTTSLADFLKQMNQAFHADQPQYHVLPDSRELTAQYLLLYDGDELGNFVDKDYTWVRISARLTEHSSQKLEQIIADVERYLNQTVDDPSVTVNITGKTFLVNKLVKNIVASQTQSLSGAFVVIFLLIFYVIGFKYGWISMIPNVVPLVMNFGIMGFFGIPLNTATAIVSAVALGITVDNTIHFLDEYQLLRSAGFPCTEAIRETFKEKFSPKLSSTLVLIFGFGILVFSSFVPTVHFGLLSAVIMVTGLLGNLVTLPAVVMLCDKGKGVRS